jgi:hypothetical protein
MSGGGSQRLARTMGNSHVMEQVLMGRIWSTPHQVREARGEHQHDHERGRSQHPGTRHGQIVHDGACAHGAHVGRSGGCMGHGRDDEGLLAGCMIVMFS